MTLERDVAVVLSLLDVDARFSRWVWRKNREQMSFWYRKDILSPLHDEWTRLSLAAVRLPFKDTHITQFRLHQQNHNSFCSALFFSISLEFYSEIRSGKLRIPLMECPSGGRASSPTVRKAANRLWAENDIKDRNWRKEKKRSDELEWYVMFGQPSLVLNRE